jgi:hypothetical protein
MCQLPDGRIVPYVPMSGGFALTGAGQFPTDVHYGVAAGNAAIRADMPTVDKFGGIAGGGRSGEVTSLASSLLRDWIGSKRKWSRLKPLTRTASIGGSLARGLRVGGPLVMALDAAEQLHEMQNAPTCTPIL